MKNNKMWGVIKRLKFELVPFFFICFLIFLPLQSVYSQSDTVVFNKKIFNKTMCISGGAYVGLYTALGVSWYANQPTSHFRFFNDNNEWMLTDKMGHAHTAFIFSATGVEVLKSLGLPKKKATIYGSLAGIIFQTPIELMDGFVSTYGASWGDMLANVSGSGFALGQYALWDEIRIVPKFSYIKTNFPQITPAKSLLGSSNMDYWLKDYNGQVYWLSVSPKKFLPKSSKFPSFLAFAIGTGATNMLRAEYDKNVELGYKPYRSYYLSIDFDLRAIKTKKVWLRHFLHTLNYVRIPLPSLSYSGNKGFGFVIH